MNERWFFEKENWRTYEIFPNLLHMFSEFFNSLMVDRWSCLKSCSCLCRSTRIYCIFWNWPFLRIRRKSLSATLFPHHYSIPWYILCLIVIVVSKARAAIPTITSFLQQSERCPTCLPILPVPCPTYTQTHIICVRFLEMMCAAKAEQPNYGKTAPSSKRRSVHPSVRSSSRHKDEDPRRLGGRESCGHDRCGARAQTVGDRARNNIEAGWRRKNNALLPYIFLSRG